mgnify:FL=1
MNKYLYRLYSILKILFYIFIVSYIILVIKNYNDKSIQENETSPLKKLKTSMGYSMIIIIGFIINIYLRI